MREKIKAILIIGATGTGKTPFGEQLETQKLWNNRSRHFDFGEQLRNAVLEKPEILEENEIEKISALLKSNSLLEESDFPIAEKLLTHFIKNTAGTDEIIILNGLPRHKTQAEAIESIVDIKLIIHFSADAYTIKKRIAYNSGGDRTNRTDDSVEEIERKLKIFKENTLPLISYYKNLDKTVLEIEIETETTPLYIIQELNSMPSLL